MFALTPAASATPSALASLKNVVAVEASPTTMATPIVKRVTDVKHQVSSLRVVTVTIRIHKHAEVGRTGFTLDIDDTLNTRS